jgi:hypothetical protein
MRLVTMLRIAAAMRGRLSLLLGWVAFAASFLRSHRQVLRAWPEATVALGPRVAVFVHFDRRGAVGEHVLLYLAALREAGLSVLFVSNAGYLRPAARAAVCRLCAGVLERRNVGYDFGAMREGLEHFGLPRADTELVLLANDSVYGPLAPLAASLARIDFGVAGLWGATDSWQTCYHLQSYFLAVGREVLDSAAWRAFWRGVRPANSKSWVVGRYEVGLTQAMLRAGVRCAALWPYNDLLQLVDAYAMMARENHAGEGTPISLDPLLSMRRIHATRIRHYMVTRTPLNPTSDLWRQLLRAGFPFLKRELLRLNPTHVADIFDWRDVVTRCFGELPIAIERDLQRGMRKRVP